MIWVGLIIALWFGAFWIFIGAMHAKELLHKGQLTTFWKVHVWPMGFVGVVLDALFNALFGTLMFRELPKEWLFSTRVQRHVNNAHGWRFKLAAFWRKNLNIMDLAHIK